MIQKNLKKWSKKLDILKKLLVEYVFPTREEIKRSLYHRSIIVVKRILKDKILVKII